MLSKDYLISLNLFKIGYFSLDELIDDVDNFFIPKDDFALTSVRFYEFSSLDLDSDLLIKLE